MQISFTCNQCACEITFDFIPEIKVTNKITYSEIDPGGGVLYNVFFGQKDKFPKDGKTMEKIEPIKYFECPVCQDKIIVSLENTKEREK